MPYRKLSDAWRHKTGPQTLGGLDALGGVEVQIPNAAELKAKNFEAPDSSNTEVSGERDRFNSINQGEPDSRIRLWGPPKPAKAPKVETKDEADRVRGTVTPVAVSSDPIGADIEVNGKFVGSTPSTIPLSAGEHTIRVTKSGKVWERTLKVTTGSHLSVNATLQ